MEIIYKSLNGRIFHDMNECLEYEKTLVFKMYGDEGLTDRADECFIVDIKTPEAVESFIEACDKMGASYDGIEHDTSGVYVWNTIDQRYFPLDPLAEEALKAYFKDKETQE